ILPSVPMRRRFFRKQKTDVEFLNLDFIERHRQLYFALNTEKRFLFAEIQNARCSIALVFKKPTSFQPDADRLCLDRGTVRVHKRRADDSQWLAGHRPCRGVEFNRWPKARRIEKERRLVDGQWSSQDLAT